MTPSKVRKLLSLWARRASRESRSVSSMVISALRKRPFFRDTCARGATRVIAPNPSMGNTPKQTPNLLQLRRIGPSIRSLIYRRVGWHFAFSVCWSSLTPSPVQSQRFTVARPLYRPVRSIGKEDGTAVPRDPRSEGERDASYLYLFSCTYSFWRELGAC